MGYEVNERLEGNQTAEDIIDIRTTDNSDGDCQILEQLIANSYDLDEFERGIKDSSYIAGYVTSLVDAGLSEAGVLEYLINKETLEHNIKVTDKVHENNLEVAKIERDIIENNRV